jgi:septal ring factor EnvC (AmiA/AmiB activator)
MAFAFGIGTITPINCYSAKKKAKSAKSSQTKSKKSKAATKASSKQKPEPKQKKKVSAKTSSKSGKGSANPQEELKKLTQSIQQTKSQIQDLTKKEQTTVSKLYQDQKKSVKITKYIGILDKQIGQLQSDINNLQKFHDKLKDRLNKIQLDYALMARKIYLESKTTSAEMALFNKPYKTEVQRDIYVRRLSGYLDETAIRISRLKDSIARQANILQEKTEQQSFLKNIKTKEANNLKSTIASKQDQLNKIRSNKSLLLKELAHKEASVRKMRSIIADLVKREEAKARKPKETKTTKPGKDQTASRQEPRKGSKEVEPPRETIAKANPSGRYTWPIGSRKILRGYGPGKNAMTNTIFDNPGVDIATKQGTAVRAVAGGTVSLISWLPGYASLVIINHGNDTRSVYANLQSVSISKNQNVSSGQVIGTTGESVDGEFLHFELWQGTRRLNPMSYLR